MPIRRPFAIALSTLVIVCATLWVVHKPAPPITATQGPPIEPVARTQTGGPSVEPAASAMPPPRASLREVDAPSSLADRVDSWSHSGDPHQAKQAYDAVFRCLLARRRAHAADLPRDAPGEDAASVCADLRSDQVQQRMALLETAARAGEKGAALDFLEEGPSGIGLLQDLDARDPTPPTADWLSRRTAYIDLALQRCDVELATYLGWFIRQRDTRQKAATQYWLGRMNCPDQPATNTTPLADDPEGQAYLAALSINDWPQ